MRSTFARSGTGFVAGAVRYRIRGRCSTFARSGTDFTAEHFRKVRYRFRGRRMTFARSGTDSVAGAALSQGQVPILWQHVRKR